MNHPDIDEAMKTGYPRDHFLPADKPEKFECRCGRAVYAGDRHVCGNCGDIGCSNKGGEGCMTYDEDLSEWFCDDECKEQRETKYEQYYAKDEK